VQLSGTQWPSLVDASGQASPALAAALEADLATLLDVAATDVLLLVVRTGTAGTLIVAFGIPSNGKYSPLRLVQRFASAGTTSAWLQHTQAQYSGIPATGLVTVVDTGVQFANTPPPEPSMAFSADAAAVALLVLFTTISTFF